MTSLWRCDVCQGLIDPVDGDERAVLSLSLDIDGETDKTTCIDLCENCRPSSLGAHVDWMLLKMEDGR